MVHLVARQQAEPMTQHGKDGAASAAEALMAALHMPIYLEWSAKIPLDDEQQGSVSAVLCAEISHGESVVWPPPKLILRVQRDEVNDAAEGRRSVVELKVPNSATAEQLDVIIAAGASLVSNVVQDSSHGHHDTISLQKSKKANTLDVDDSRGLQQPQCLQQWHHDVCGHHALFNAQCLLNQQHHLLQDESQFWKNLLRNTADLADHGEASQRWPRSRVVGGVLDALHLRHLIDSDNTLQERVSVTESVDTLRMQLEDTSSFARRGIEALRSGQRSSHAFLLGATKHWYAAVVVADGTDDVAASGPYPNRKINGADDDASTSNTTIYFCDSYNEPLVRLQSEEQIEQVVCARLTKWREFRRSTLLKEGDWKHRTGGDLEDAVENGVPEWWKGAHKTSLFWRLRPAGVHRKLLTQELEDVRGYLKELLGALKPTL